MGKFWIEDDFIREYIKQFKLPPNAALVYVALSCHADKHGYTFIGTRTLGDMLNLSKSAVARAINQLETVPLVGHRKQGLSHLRVLTVPNQRKSVPLVGHKEVFKEVFKEEKISLEEKKRAEEAKERIRRERGWVK